MHITYDYVAHVTRMCTIKIIMLNIASSVVDWPVAILFIRKAELLRYIVVDVFQLL